MSTKAPLDAFAHLRSLVGETIPTLTHAKPNTILGFEGSNVLIATTRAPHGEPVDISEVQAALDRLAAGEEVEVTPKSLGYRSAFIGAALAKAPGAKVISTRPRRVTL